MVSVLAALSKFIYHNFKLLVFGTHLLIYMMTGSVANL